ncbi:MAG: hypothetical protein M3R04_07735 [bacterium]|nr:hypothetical protein [bacterium]
MIYSLNTNDPNDYGVDIAHVDPLERARIALDFEAIAVSAPPVRDILFKAQTMGPVAPVHELWRPRPAGLALGFCLLMLLVPWLPQRSSFTLMQIGFEQTIARMDAEKLAAHLVRNQPANVLLQTEFTPSNPGQAGLNVPGRLRVSLTAFNTSEQKVEQTYRSQISNYQSKKIEPMFRVEQRVEHSGLHSPALLALGLFKAKQQQVLHLDDQSQLLAQLVSGSNKLMATALAPEIENIANGLKLKSVGFGGTVSKEDYDFSIEAWPRPMNFSVEGFDALDGENKQKVMSAAAGFVEKSNLALVTAPALSELPLQVHVYREGGSFDSMSTRLVQAWISQDDPEGIAAGPASRVNESEIVKRAMDGAMKNKAFSADYKYVGGKTIVSIYLGENRGSLFNEDLQNAEAEAEKSAAMGEL